MARGTTKSHGRKNENDKFYTKPSVARESLQMIPGGVDSYTVWIEPSAGSGAFSEAVPGCIALDLAPEADGIIEQDWFLYQRVRNTQDRVLVFGNPPFGQQNSLAVKFINHAALFADAVAFILPRSFKKASIQNRLHPHLHLAFEQDVPRNAFLLEGVDYDVPCVFQVWEFDSSKERQKAEEVAPSGFAFVKKGNGPDMSIQRVGGRAGFADANWHSKSESSHYFVKFTGELDRESLHLLVQMFNGLTHPNRDHSVGPRSLSKSDISQALNPLVPKTE